MKKDGSLQAEKLKWFRFLVIVILLAVICICAYVFLLRAREPEVTTSFVSGKLREVSDLTTSELSYTGLIKYSEGNIPFLTQNSFSMIYTANIRAGIDVSKAKVKVTKRKVTVTLPKHQVQSVDVDTDSIEFYDEHLALFNWTKKDDIVDAVSAARDDVLKKADINSLLDNARSRTEILIRSLLEDAVGNRELVIQ